MKLLITTQAVDIHDPILGFFHGWLIEFAKHFERLDVICLREGKHELPPNVFVHSLGKEKGENRLRYVWRFYKYVWRLRNTSETVFSHMNPHYIVLAGWFWYLRGTPMYLWRNHAKMNVKTWVAAQFARRVFYTSPFACTTHFKHSMQMPVGIDTSVFKPRTEVLRKNQSVLFLGRLSSVKRPELFMKTAALLPGLAVNVYGDVPLDSNVNKIDLENLANGNATFHPAVPNYETPPVYSAHDIYVNLTPEGSMDKTVLEAAACGCLVLVTNKSFTGQVPELCLLQEEAPQSIAKVIETLGNLPEEQKNEYRKELRTMVEQKHSLALLAESLARIMGEK